ncbi:glycosyltransferase family 4 protein [Pedobacter sp. 22226]|uniref:glycosyltransferase family 4 protein n=1 Tax=Pedobacter sp. 22226 TaxID=3453894 RepID=UPI003F87B3EA
MKIKLLNRNFNENENSLEKLFQNISVALLKKGVEISSISNPFGHGLINMVKSILFFRNKITNDELVHITGQVHYAAIGLKTSKIIITVHDLGLYRKLSKLRFLFFKLFWVYLPFKKAKYIVCISKKTKDEIINLMPSAKSKIAVIPNCLTVPIIAETSVKNNIKKELLIVGTRSNKNIERIFESVKDLNIHLNIVGRLNESHINILDLYNIEYTNSYNISDDDLLYFYDKSDALIFTSTYEGFGLPILEAQARNAFVITSDLAPMNEVVGDGGIVVNPFKADEIRSAIVRFIEMSEDEKYGYLSEGKKNLNKYAVENIAESYISLYNRV